MANTIRHKRGTTTPAAASLVTGELAINTATGDVFTKTDGGSVVSISPTALAGKANLSGATFTGPVITPASTTTASGFNLVPGVSPTTPNNGDLWVTTGGALNARLGGATLSFVTSESNQTITGSKTFSSANLAFGSSVTTGTVSLASGATISANTKTITIGAGGVSGSTTSITLGTSAGGTNAITVNGPTTFAAGTKTTVSHSATTAGLNVGPVAGDPSGLANGDVWNNSTTNKLRAQINGATQNLATEAFVTSAVPALSATADVIAPASNTKATSPKTVLDMLMFPGYQVFLGGGAVGTSGTGAAAPSTTQRWRYFVGPNAATAGYSAFVFDTNASGTGFYGSGRGLGDFRKNFARRFWVSGRTIIGSDAGNGGDANNLYRCELGGRTVLGAVGDPDNTSLGWRVAGGGSQAIVFYLRTRAAVNGGVYSSVTSSFTPVINQWFDWTMVYDGSANAFLFVNDVQVATIAATFSGYQQPYNHYTEQIEQTASAATRMAVSQLPTRVYFAE